MLRSLSKTRFPTPTHPRIYLHLQVLAYFIVPWRMRLWFYICNSQIHYRYYSHEHFQCYYLRRMAWDPIDYKSTLFLKVMARCHQASSHYELSQGQYKFTNWDSFKKMFKHINGLVQDCSNSSALAMELLQSCTKPWIYWFGWSFTWITVLLRERCSKMKSAIRIAIENAVCQNGDHFVQGNLS